MAIMRYWNTTWTNQAVVCESGTKSNESMIWEIPSRMKYFEQSNLYNLCFWDFRHGEEFRCPPPLTIKCTSQYMISLDRNPGLRSKPILHLHPPLAISLWFDIDYSTYQLNMIGYDRKQWHHKNALFCPPCLQLWHLRSAVVRVNPAKTTERCAISSCDILVSAWSSSRPKKYGTVFRMNSWPAKKKSRKRSGVNRLDSNITWPFSYKWPGQPACGCLWVINLYVLHREYMPVRMKYTLCLYAIYILLWVKLKTCTAQGPPQLLAALKRTVALSLRRWSPQTYDPSGIQSVNLTTLRTVGIHNSCMIQISSTTSVCKKRFCDTV